MAKPADDVVFTTLGMFILDEIEFPDGGVLKNVIGGAGTYGALGARLFLPPPDLSRKVGWIVDVGKDFPSQVRNTLESWNTNVVFREDMNRLTTRGFNIYGLDEHRGFKYLTPKKRLEPQDLAECGLLGAKSVHIIASPQRTLEILKQLDALGSSTDSMVVWEPVPDSCHISNLDTCLQVLQDSRIRILSPNAAEAAAMLGVSPSTEEAGKYLSDTRMIEDMATRFYSHMNSRGACVIRAGRQGCVVADSNGITWLSAYYNTSDTAKQIVDPTGAGNTFVGAFSAVYTSTGNAIIAAAAGNVASSFAIEQIGMPILDSNSDSCNKESVMNRFQQYLRRENIKMPTTPHLE